MKRCLDIFISGLALLFLFPILIPTMFLSWFFLGRPIFFAQKRPGINSIPFSMYKFRTMTEARNKQGSLLPDNRRLTPYGQFLRSTSIDELPELWNVLIGEMSIVGPRPLLMEYVPLYNKEQMRRHEVRPGITGWAQINGRNSLSWEDKFALDVWYVDNHSIWLDLKIIFLTLKKVVLRSDISADGEATMQRFKGSE